MRKKYRCEKNVLTNIISALQVVNLVGD